MHYEFTLVKCLVINGKRTLQEVLCGSLSADDGSPLGSPTRLERDSRPSDVAMGPDAKRLPVYRFTHGATLQPDTGHEDRRIPAWLRVARPLGSCVGNTPFLRAEADCGDASYPRHAFSGRPG